MGSLHLTVILLFLLTVCCSSTRTIRTFTAIKLSQNLDLSLAHRHSKPTTSTKHTSVAYFLAHPLWIGSSISFSAGFLLGLIAFLVWRLTIKRCVKFDPITEPATLPTLFSPLIRSIDDLFFLCGETCANLEVIGRGGCGEVYKAEILTGGQIITVAVKKILQPSLMDASRLCNEESKLLGLRMRQIKSEIVTVGRMRHPHLVSLLAHIPRPESHYLVYEYMPNGSLQDVLRNREAREKLTWPVRLRIAQGIAAGIEYLHVVHRPRVIHRDLKPANILLDENLNARIADFGLAKVVPEAISGGISSVNVAGTLGYIAPEYYQMLSCTAKSDIYSFGVILAVLITGKFPTDEFFITTEEMCLVAWVRKMALSENPQVAIDPVLLGAGYEEEMILGLKIACFCTYDSPNERPSSKEIFRMLSQIKH